MESALTSKGQATIPKPIRDHLHLKPVHPDGTVVLLPKLPPSALRGIVKPLRRPVSIAEMDEAAATGAADQPMRRKRR